MGKERGTTGKGTLEASGRDIEVLIYIYYIIYSSICMIKSTNKTESFIILNLLFEL